MLNLLSTISICAILAGLIGVYIGYQMALNNCHGLDEDDLHH